MQINRIFSGTLLAMFAFYGSSLSSLSAQAEDRTGRGFGNQRKSCPVNIRIINAASPNSPTSVDLYVNNRRVVANVPFRQVSEYISVNAGELDVSIKQAGTTTELGSRIFIAPPNAAYTIGITGPIPGPTGQTLFNNSPFVIPEDLSIPNPGKFRGRWYRFSETNAVIDFRATKVVSGVLQENLPDAMRITVLTPKTVITYPELDAGVYNFNPVGVGSNSPLVNDASLPPVVVQVLNATVAAGTIFDVIALGNSLGTNPNTLTLTTATTKVLAPNARGCTRLSL